MKPNIIIFCGPFIPKKHSLIESGNLIIVDNKTLDYEELFLVKFIAPIKELLGVSSIGIS